MRGTQRARILIAVRRKLCNLSSQNPANTYLKNIATVQPVAKNYLLNGELLFVFSGYSFSDQHINDIVFNSLRQNKRLLCIILFYKDAEVEAFHGFASSYMNLNVFGPNKAIVNGTMYEWEFKKNDLKDNEKFDSYYDDKNNELKLGDFKELVNFFIMSSGKAGVLNRAVFFLTPDSRSSMRKP